VYASGTAAINASATVRISPVRVSSDSAFIAATFTRGHITTAASSGSSTSQLMSRLRT
jgi:hypothetical protein